jgi:hypothetical protein
MTMILASVCKVKAKESGEPTKGILNMQSGEENIKR